MPSTPQTHAEPDISLAFDEALRGLSGSGCLLLADGAVDGAAVSARASVLAPDAVVIEVRASATPHAFGPWRQVVQSLAEAAAILPLPEREFLLNIEPGAVDPSHIPSLTAHHALYRMLDAVRLFLTTASRSQPVVIVLGPVESHDLPSLRLLVFLAPFLQNMRVLLVASADFDNGAATAELSVLRGFGTRVAGNGGAPARGSAEARPTALDVALEQQLSRGDGTADATRIDRCIAMAAWAKSVGAPDFAARYLAAARAASGDRPSSGLVNDLLLMNAEAGRHDDIAPLLQEWLALFDRSADDISRMALALNAAGVEPRSYAVLTHQLLEAPAHTLAWARRQLLRPPEIVEIADGRVKVGRWVGSDPVAKQIIRADGTEEDIARTLVVYDWWSRDDVDALLSLSAKWTDHGAKARALSVAAETLMYRHGAFDRACRQLEQLLDMERQRGAIEEQAKCLVRLSMALLANGELDRAHSSRELAREMVGRLGPNYVIYEHSGTKSGGDLYPEISMESNFAWYRDGDWLAVAEHWAKAVAMHENGGSPVHIVEAAMASQAYARLERPDDARLYLDELVAILPHLQPRDWAFNGAVGRASHAIWDLQDPSYATDFLCYAQAMLAAGVGDWTNTSLELTVARMAALLGNFDLAWRHFGRARDELNEAQAPQRAIVDFDEAIALRLAGETGGRRSALLDDARAGFTANRILGWLERLQREAARTGVSA